MAKKYTSSYKSKVRDQEPIIAQRGVSREPPLDMYFVIRCFFSYSRDASVFGAAQPAIRRTSRSLPTVSRTWGVSAQREDVHAFVLTSP